GEARRIRRIGGDGVNLPAACALELGEGLAIARDHVHHRPGREQGICDPTAKSTASADHQGSPCEFRHRWCLHKDRRDRRAKGYAGEPYPFPPLRRPPIAGRREGGWSDDET